MTATTGQHRIAKANKQINYTLNVNDKLFSRTKAGPVALVDDKLSFSRTKAGPVALANIYIKKIKKNLKRSLTIDNTDVHKERNNAITCG